MTLGVLSYSTSANNALVVDANHTADVSGTLTLSSVVGLTLLGNTTVTLEVYDETTGTWTAVASSATGTSLLGVDLLISGNTVTFSASGLDEGTYRVTMEVTGVSLSVLPTLTLDATVTDIDYTEVSAVSGSTSGNVLTDTDATAGTDTVDANTVVTEVENSSSVTTDVASTGTTTINGQYGTLVIAADGTYTYTLNDSTSGLGQTETFTYTISSGATTSTATLDIYIDPTAYSADSVAVADTADLSADASNAETAGVTDTISYSWLLSGLGGETSGTSSFTVASGTVETVTVTVASSQSVSVGGNTVVTVTDASTGAVVASTSAGSLLDVVGILTNGNTVVISGLAAGNYIVTVESDTGISLTGTVTTTITHEVYDLDSFVTATETVTGNILDGTDSASVSDTLGSSFTTITVHSADNTASYTLYQDGDITDSSGTTVSTSTVELEGKYGTLTIAADGSYSYTLDSGIDLSTITSKESFSYTLTDIDGHTSDASLTINLDLNITGTTAADTVQSTAYDDTFTLGEGADTLVYHLLNSADATGGNGTDTWTDFQLGSTGDKIDVTDLLDSSTTYSTTSTDANYIGNYISVSTVTNTDGTTDTVVSIDRDGTAGTTYTSTELITLKDTNTTLDDLLNNNQLLY